MFKDVAVVVMEVVGGEVAATPEYDTTQLAIFEALKIKAATVVVESAVLWV